MNPRLIMLLGCLAVGSVGCAQKNRTTIERHYHEEIHTTHPYEPSNNQRHGETDSHQQGDRQGGQVTVEQHVSEPIIIVE